MDYSFSSKLRAIAIVSAIAVSMAAGAFLALLQAYSQQSVTLSDAPTIKDIGDATTSVVPDQATVLVNVQTQPDDLADVLEEQDERIEEIRSAVQAAAPDATISIGYHNISPYYTGYGTPVNDEVTFNVYATTTIQTNINPLSDLVNALAEAGFGFESVYIDPYYSQALERSWSTRRSRERWRRPRNCDREPDNHRSEPEHPAGRADRGDRRI